MELKLSEKQKLQLGWLPEVGEWYKVGESASLWAFESVLDLLKFYKNPPQISRWRSRDNVSDMLHLTADTAIFITRITLPDLEDQPAIIEFMTMVGDRLSKAMFLPIIPPASQLASDVWKTILVRISLPTEASHG